VCGTAPVGQPKRFTGKERDTETGLDYFGARYYGANVGRFTAIDPVYTWQENLVDPQRWNRYAYARNNPLKYVDPDGRAIDTLWDIGNVIYDICSGWKTGNWTDLRVDLAATAIPFLPAGASKLRHLDDAADAAQTRLRANKAAGDAFEDVVAAQKSAEQTGVVRQLTVRAESGVKTKIDVAGRDAAGNVRLTEAKSSATARLTPNQRKAFPEIERTGGTVVGRGKPGLEGGTKIPPTTVEVCRPNCK
jgi:RHS repeat-associated protein